MEKLGTNNNTDLIRYTLEKKLFEQGNSGQATLSRPALKVMLDSNHRRPRIKEQPCLAFIGSSMHGTRESQLRRIAYSQGQLTVLRKHPRHP